jgi:predicted TPR repeat methyltransferase
VENEFYAIPERDETIESLRERLLLSPQDTGAMLALAGLLEAAGDLPGAVDLYQRALRVEPYNLPALLALGRLWTQFGDRARARSWYQRALSVEADNEMAAAGLAMLDSPDELTLDYIRTLFDQYAHRFDSDLTGTLKYRAPQAVAELLKRCGAVEGSVLDLGCGTGLSGAALKPFARRLEGVDLSPGMVDKAQARGIYAALSVGEAQAFLKTAERTWDLIAAVDVLNYIADLLPVFAEAAARLSHGGFFAGTVEKRAEGGTVLTEKRRYRHGEDHVRASASAAGFTIVELVEDVLRHEGGEPVAGLIFVMRRSG